MIQDLKKDRLFWASILLGVVLILPLVLLIYMNSMTGSTRGYLTGDFVAHIKLAEGISLQKMLDLGVPHLLMHLLFHKISGFLSLSMEAIFFCYTIFSVCALVIIKIFFLKENFPRTSWVLAAGMAAISGYLGALDNPLNPLPLYLGVWSPLVYHSPTTLWLKPFAALFLWNLFRWGDDERKLSVKHKIGLSLILGMATIIKPNFTIAIGPALLIAVCLKRYHWSILTVFIPAVAILAAQYVITFGAGVDSKVIFTPGLAWAIYTNSIPLSIFRNIFGAVFLSLYLCFKKELGFKLQFLWILMVVSLLEAVFLAEAGPRFEGMNFGWGYTITVEFLFLYLLGYCAQLKRSGSFKIGIFVLFGLHFCYGIFYLFDAEFVRVLKIVFPQVG